MNTDMRTLLAIAIVIIGGVASQAIAAITHASTTATVLISIACLVAFTAIALLASAPAHSTRPLRRTTAER